jgi:SAM-dependent methyltransferase
MGRGDGRVTSGVGENAGAACAICGHPALRPVLDLDAVPVLCTQILHDADEARDVPRGDIRLAICERCSYVGNVAFDPTLVEYDGDYENSQFFSASFQAYADDLARHLVASHGLDGGIVVEIGSGKGEFLALLCRAGAARGVGFDPSYGGEVADSGADLNLEFVTELYREDSAVEPADLVCARHVLEHIEAPVEFLQTVRAAMRHSGARVLYLEVPNAGFTLGAAGLWDVIYQHRSYFTAAALRETVRQAGFEVTDLRERFDGQFLSVEAIPAPEHPLPAPDRREIEQFIALAEGASRRQRDNVARWEAVLATVAPESTALWGAGAKGVMFLNAVSPGAVGVAVDVNPRKWGSRVPGTAQRVVSPADLSELVMDHVIVSNGAYEDEIRQKLASLGVTAPVSVL